MKRKLVILVLVSLSSITATGFAAQAETQPGYPDYCEFYWDDGSWDGGWAWYTTGNYWAVQFDEEKTGGSAGTISKIGATVVPGWPDDTYEGAYIHIYDHVGGEPGSSIAYEYLATDASGDYVWVDGFEYQITTSIFYLVWEQVGGWDTQCDALAHDAEQGDHNHNWYYEDGVGWDIFYADPNGDFMLRCYWEAASSIEEGSWGHVKWLYR